MVEGDIYSPETTEELPTRPDTHLKARIDPCLSLTLNLPPCGPATCNIGVLHRTLLRPARNVLALHCPMYFGVSLSILCQLLVGMFASPS